MVIQHGEPAPRGVACRDASRPGALLARRQGLLRLVACLGAPALLSGCASRGGPGPGPLAQADQDQDQDPELGRAASGEHGRDDAAAAYRLANRLSWGANDAEVDSVRRLGAAAYIAQQLRADAGPLPAAAQAQIDALRIQSTPPLALWQAIDAARKLADAQPTEAGRKAGQDAFQAAQTRLAREASHRLLLRALYAPNQLQEQLQWFWFNHFNVHQFKSNIRVLLGDYTEQAIRPHGLGSFRALLGAATRHPAMLRYLDNEQNAVGRVNENQARELLELHTLGVSGGGAAYGGWGGYSQGDVQEVAKVLTGHGVNFTDKAPTLKQAQEGLYRRDGIYEFHPARHDFSDKTVLGQAVRGRGAAELDQVLDLLAVHPSTARHISLKLARHLLADEPPPAIVEAMAATWQRSAGRIDAVLGVLLRSPAFTAVSRAPAAKFKDPLHYVVSAVRAAYGERVLLNTQPMQNWLNRMGQGLFGRQTPDGYPAAAAHWTGSGQMAVRLEIARAIGGNSAALFKGEDPAAQPEQPAFPQLARALYWQVQRPLLAPATRDALDRAATPQDWNTLYLSSPEFMYC
jgi:uncharacterized protein (DUF1800 family)